MFDTSTIGLGKVIPLTMLEGGETGASAKVSLESNPDEVSELLGEGGKVVVLKSIVIQSFESINEFDKSGNKAAALVTGGMLSLIKLS